MLSLALEVTRDNNAMFSRETGEPFHRLITWQDLRASDYVEAWNKSYIMKVRGTHFCG